MTPRFPLYIVSRSRWQPERRLTNQALERMQTPHFIVVEADQADEYRAVVNPHLCTVLVLDAAYQRDYETCDDLGLTKPVGAGAARNFVWDHALAAGYAWHWVMDDNIRSFMRLRKNTKIRLSDGTGFRAMEDFALRYTNVAMAGPNYQWLAKQRQFIPPFITNTRIYSCNLIRNDVPFRWRGRYNEDTILSLDMLKAGWCTVQFNAFLQDKQTTQQVKGGNTDVLYANGTLEKSRMQVRVHPDVSRLVWKFGRWHHHVDYRPFKANRLKRRPDVVIPDEPNEYGMRLVHLSKQGCPQ